MSKNNLLFMSPNEALQLEKSEYNQRRTQRLLEVRQQEKLNAASRRLKYKKAHQQEWTLTLSELKNNYLKTQQSELQELQEIKENRRKDLGLGMDNALYHEHSKNTFISSFRQTVIHDQKMQDIRFYTSLKHSKQEEYERLRPLLEKRILLQEIARKEQLRSQKAANAFREKLAKGEITNIEIPPCPVGRWERERMKAFDETCFHRDFAAVKCLNVRDQENQQDAWDAAKIAERELISLQDKRAAHLIKLREAEDNRKKNAIKGLHMDQERIQLDKEMQELLLEDRKRRQENAGAYAGVFRPLYAEIGENSLKAKFETQFNIGDDGLDDTQDSKSLTRFKRIHEERKENTTLDNSIEFIEENVELQVFKPQRK